MDKNNKKFTGLFNWSIFSEYRNQLFGVAIIFILLFHSAIFINYGRIYVIISQLNMGVEMFLFLSGIGLYFSYVKKPSYSQFERKRFVTVGVVYLITSLPFCIWQNIVEKRNFLYFLFDWSSLSYWFKTENSPSWYVSLIAILYILYPLLYKLVFSDNKRCFKPYIVTVFFVILILIISLFLSKNNTIWSCIERAFTRVPCFLVGCCCGKLVYEKREFNVITYVFLIMCSCSFILFDRINFRFRYFLTIIPIMLIIIVFIYIMVNVLKFKVVSTVLFFFGSMTLELYLIHNFLSEIFQYYSLTRPYYYIIIVIVSIPLSYFLSILRKKIISRYTKKESRGS